MQGGQTQFCAFSSCTMIQIGDPRRRLPTWRMLGRFWAFPNVVSSGCLTKDFLCVFISHSKLELPVPMSRVERCCHHVPAIGCNCQWKQHQPHHRSRRGIGDPPWGGEDIVFSVQAKFPLSLSGRNNTVIISVHFIYGNRKCQLSALFICDCGWNWGNFLAIVLLNKILKYKYQPVCPSAPPRTWTCMGVLFLSQVLAKWRQPLLGLGNRPQGERQMKIKAEHLLCSFISVVVLFKESCCMTFNSPCTSCACQILDELHIYYTSGFLCNLILLCQDVSSTWS